MRLRVVLSGLDAEAVDELRRSLDDVADITVLPTGELARLGEAEAGGVVVLGPGVADPSGVATTLLGRHRSLAVVIAAPAGEVAPVAEHVLLGPALTWATSGRPASIEAAIRGSVDRAPTGVPPTHRPSGPRGPVVAAMTEALAGGLERPLHDRLGDAARLLAAHLGVPAGVWMPGENGLDLVVAVGCPDAPSPGGEDAARQLPSSLPLDWLEGAPAPSPDVLLLRREGPLLAFPLVVDRRVRAFLGVLFEQAPAADVEESVALLAGEIGRALRRELRHGRAALRAEAWQRLTAGLAAAVTLADVAQVVAEHAAATVEATSCAVALPRPGRELHHVGDPRLGPVEASYDTRLPLAEVLRTGRLVTAEGPTEIATRYPSLAQAPGADALASIIATPVRSTAGDDIAALGFGWPAERRLGPTGRAELNTLAQLCSLSLERARLYQLEARERLSAERGVDRLRRLQRATAGLSAPLPFAAAARAVLREAVALFGGTGGIVAVVGTSGDELELLARTGQVPNDGVWRSARAGGAPDALVTAWRAGQPAWAGAAAHDGPGTAALWALPLSWEGRPQGVLGIAFDPAELLGTAEDRQRALALTFAEQAAQALERARLYDLEVKARHRSQQLSEATGALARSLGLIEVAEATARAAAGIAGADGAAVLLRDERDRDLVHTVATWAVPPERAELFQRFRLRAASPLGEAIRERRPDGAADLDEAAARWPRYADTIRRSGYVAWQVVPLELSNEVIGGIVVGFDRPHPASTDEHVALSGLANRCVQAIYGAKRFELEHQVAVGLQASLLTSVAPFLAGLRVTVRYQAAADNVQVGGDWYDVVDLGEGRLYLVAGDLVGSGLGAAAAMGQLRSAARGLLATGPGPAELLDGLDEFVSVAPGAEGSTLACVMLDTKRGEVRYALAGHLPPLVRSRGTVVALDGARSGPLGSARGPRPEAVLPLEAGSTLVLYTDGLVARRQEPLDVGVERLVSVLADLEGQELEALADALISRSLGGRSQDDDLALVCVAFDARPDRSHLQRLPSDLALLPAARHELRRWLDSQGLDDDVVTDMLLATGEALNNALEHPHTRGMLTLRAHVDDGKLVVRVRDEGRWQARPPSSSRGRGLRIMGSLVDAVELHRTENGTTVVLRRSL